MGRLSPKNMSVPKITYFAARGRVELARVVLATAGVEWEEEHLNPESLAALKETGKLAFGQVPLYEDGDVTLVRSIARKYNLYGDLKQGAIADLVLDGWGDVLAKFIPLVYPTKNEEGLAAFVKDVAPAKVADFERIAVKYAEGGLIGGESPVLADLALFLVAEGVIVDLEWVKAEDVPALQALKEKVASNPNLAAYISSEKRFPARKL